MTMGFLLVNSMSENFYMDTVYLLIFVEVLFCLIPILGILISDKNEKVAGVLYIASGIVICISIGLLGLIPLALLGYAGKLSFEKKDQTL